MSDTQEEVAIAFTPEQSTNNSQVEQSQNAELSTIKCETDNCQEVFTNIEDFEAHVKEKHIKDPNRNEKGQFVAGNNANAENKGGRPCEYCKKPEEILKKIELYNQWTRGKVDHKIHVPFLEELCDEDYLDIDEDTLTNWTEHAHDKALHAEIIGAIKALFNRQKLFLKKRVLTDKNPTGGIFLLKANHGLMEAEKKVIVGEKGSEPLTIEIIEERPKADD